MIDISAVQLARAAEQMDSYFSARQIVHCRCGCGKSWLRERRSMSGRERLYVDATHRTRENQRRKRQRARETPLGVTG